MQVSAGTGGRLLECHSLRGRAVGGGQWQGGAGGRSSLEKTKAQQVGRLADVGEGWVRAQGGP